MGQVDKDSLPIHFLHHLYSEFCKSLGRVTAVSGRCVANGIVPEMA